MGHRSFRAVSLFVLLVVTTGLTPHATATQGAGDDGASSRVAGWNAENLWGYFRYAPSPDTVLADGTQLSSSGSIRYYKVNAAAQAFVVFDTLSTTIYPDPDPNEPGCWLWKEEARRVGTSAASWSTSIHDGVPILSGAYQNDGIGIPTTFTATYAGGKDSSGRPCSEQDFIERYNDFGMGEIWQFSVNRNLLFGVSSYDDGLDGFNEFVRPVLVEYNLRSAPPSDQAWVTPMGKQDYVTVFSVQRTLDTNAGVGFFDQKQGAPIVCTIPGVKKVNKACALYKGVTAVEWLQARYFMSDAVRWGSCGLWVHDGANWRSPNIKSAKGMDGRPIVRLNVGETRLVRTASGGSVSVTCSA